MQRAPAPLVAHVINQLNIKAESKDLEESIWTELAGRGNRRAHMAISECFF